MTKIKIIILCGAFGFLTACNSDGYGWDSYGDAFPPRDPKPELDSMMPPAGEPPPPRKYVITPDEQDQYSNISDQINRHMEHL